MDIWGYDKTDFEELRRSAAPRRRMVQERSSLEEKWRGSGYGDLGRLGLREPNTFSYALCDSPVGILGLVCGGLRWKSPNHKLSSTEIIDLTELAWLPGPEAAIRFLAAGVREVESLEREKRTKSRVAVTVFGSDGATGDYICPAWANTKHNVGGGIPH